MGAKRGASIWDRLIGPVLLFDLLRLTRRGSITIFLARTLYLGLMLLVIVIFCGIELELLSPAHFLEAFRAGFPVTASKAASFAAHFFFVLLGAQLAMVVLLTPAYVAGAIAEDRERRIMDYLLVSDLSNREIVLGKYLSRLAHLGLLLLTGAPLLAVAQVLGGVHPVFLLTGLVLALMTMASLGALSILESICNSRPHRAIFHIYMGVGFYMLISTGFTLARVPSAWSALSIADRAGLICMSANPLLPMVRLVQDLGTTDCSDGVLVEALTDCAIIHGIFSIGCLGLAIHRLRSFLASTPLSRAERLALRLQKCHDGLSPETARQLAASARPHDSSVSFRPPLQDQPILWKELHIASAPFRFSQEMSAAIYAVLRILTIISGSTFPLLLLMRRIMGSPNEDLWFPLFALSTILVCLLMAGVAVRAARCLSGEREQNTLEALLATDLDNAAIINGKWLASLVTMRWCWLLLAIVWGTSTLVGALDPGAFLYLILATVIWACWAASLGLSCSLLCRDTWRATGVTLGVLLAMGTFPGLLGWWEPTPLGALCAFTVPIRWKDHLPPNVRTLEVTPALWGVFVYSVLAALLWSGAHFFFPRVTGRMPVPRKSRREQHALAES